MVSISPPYHHPSSKFTSSRHLRMQEWHHPRTRVYQPPAAVEPDTASSSDSVSTPIIYEEDDDENVYEEEAYSLEEASPSLIRKQNFGVLIPSTILEVDEDFEDERSLGHGIIPAGGLLRKHRQMGFHDLIKPETASNTSVETKPKRKKSKNRTSSPESKQLTPILRSTVENGEAAAATATEAPGPSDKQKRKKKKVKKRSSSSDLRDSSVSSSSSWTKKHPHKDSKHKESKHKESKESVKRAASQVKKQGRKDPPESFGVL